jgi:hypothetical protein
MTIRAVIFDIGGVILLEAGEGLETKWERRLGLKEGGHVPSACKPSCSRIRPRPSLMCKHAFYNHRSQLDLGERDQTMFEGIDDCLATVGKA